MFVLQIFFTCRRSWPQKIAVGPRSGASTIRDGMLQKVFWDVLRVFQDDLRGIVIALNTHTNGPSLIVHDPLRGRIEIFCGQYLI